MENNSITEKVLRIGVKNLNERIYTMEAAEKMVKDFKEKRNKIGAFFGQLGFPESSAENILMGNVSHDVQDVWIAGDSLWAEIKILDTPAGKTLKSLMESRGLENHIVFRSRSAGTVNENGEVKINQLFSFDAIHSKDDSFFGIIL